MGSPNQPELDRSLLGSGRLASGATSVPDQLIEHAWMDIKAGLQQRAGEIPQHWLDQLDPLSLRHGTLHLSTRSRHTARFVEHKYLRLLAKEAQRHFGTAVRVRIEVDQSLGGALHRLGLLAPPRQRAPRPVVVRGEIRLAHGCILQMARERVSEWDRLLILGPAQSGKSHLLDLFHFQRLRQFPRERWLRRSAASFYLSFARAAREGTMTVHRGEILAHDGWLVDDLQELSGKMRSQEYLIEILEYFRSRHRPVIMTARHLPGSDREFLPRLRSLVASGMTAPIPALSERTRREILRRRFPSSLVGDDFCEDLARSALTLDDSLARVRRMADLAREVGRTLRREEWLERSPELLPPSPSIDPMDRILDRAAEFAGVSRDAIVTGVRSKGAALGRHLSIYLAIEVFHMRRSTIKGWLGRLSPSVVPYVKKKVHELRRSDPRVDGFVREVSEEIGKGQRFLF